MSKQAPPPTADKLNFEQLLERLEQIVHQLEQGDEGLSAALARYEEGVTLLRQAHELLQRAERRVELLCGVDAEGNPITQPFDDSATTDSPESGPRRRRRGSLSSAPEQNEEQ